MKKIILTSTFICVAIFNSVAQKNKVIITTTEGKIVLELYDQTPKHTNNMIKLAEQHFFDSTLFHRCIPGFVIQGGDPNSRRAKPGEMLGNGETGYRIDAEFNDSLIHKYGALAMARDENPAKASSGCQFYIVIGKKLSDDELNRIEQRNKRIYTPEQREIYKTKGGTAFLDGNYTVFGEVLEGMDVVEKIAAEPRNQMDRPEKDIRMLKVEVIKPKVVKQIQKKNSTKKKKFLGIF